MGDINVAVVREFFELHGFLVTVNRKFAVTRRGEVPGPDLYVENRSAASGTIARRQGEAIVLDGGNVGGIARAAVSVRGWHTDVFSPALLQRAADVFDFCSEADLRAARRFFAGEEFSRMLVVSRLPKTRSLRQEALRALGAGGVSHVLEFGTMLSCLVDLVKTNKNYTESDVLQMVRLFKCYKLVAEDQLSLFERRRRRTS